MSKLKLNTEIKKPQKNKLKPLKNNNFKNSLRSIIKQYCEESSICGLKHLVNENTSSFERWIWKLAMILALISSLSLVWVTFDKYYKAPLVTTQLPEGISVNQIIFPAIGICSTNRISKAAATELARELILEERNQKYNEKEMLSLLSGLGYLYNSLNYDDPTFLIPLQQALGDYDVKILLKRLTPRCEDLLLACLWNENPKNCSDLFDFRLTMNGYCCTFNYLRDSDEIFQMNVDRNIDMYSYGNKSAFDFDQGLKVVVQVNETDIFYNKFDLQGTVLQFSDAYDFPDEPSGSFAIQVLSPSVQITVSISASLTEASRDIQHIPLSLRQCLFHDESPYLHFYTYSDCLLKCRMLFLYENCNCTPFNMPSMQNTKTCDLSDLLCLKLFNEQSIAIRPELDPLLPELELDLSGGGISCPMCYPACSKTAYTYEFNNVNIYQDYLNSLPDRSRDPWLAGVNFTGTSILHVKYASEVANCFEQNVIMKWFDLFSNIGSTCGFVTGFSFVSVLEFLYFFTVKLARDSKERKREESKKAIEKKSDMKQQIAQRRPNKQTPLYWEELTINIPSSYKY